MIFIILLITGKMVDTNQTIDLTNKEYVKNLSLSLENIVKVSEEAFKKISHLKNFDLLLALGNTGCGKSTMITSLVFGHENLEIV